MLDPTSQQEQNFVQNFLKEITDIEDLNSRFHLNLQESINETNSRYQVGQYSRAGDSMPHQNYSQAEPEDFRFKPYVEPPQYREADERVDENPRPTTHYTANPGVSGATMQ